MLFPECNPLSYVLIKEHMLDSELQQGRAQKWHLDGTPVRTLEEAREFIESVGFCSMYPLRPPVLLATFVGAFIDADDRLPTSQYAFADPRAQSATELMVRLLRDKAAFEANLFEENNNFLVTASVFPYFYALVGERNPKQHPKAGARSEYSQLAVDAFEIIRGGGPISRQRLRDQLGGDVSLAALDRALNELWSKLRITRVDYSREEGASWDVLYRWAPDAVREGAGMSVPAELSGQVSKYLDSVGAAEQEEVEKFFSNLVPRSR